MSNSDSLGQFSKSTLSGRFSALQTVSLCPYAKSAKVAYAPEWDCNLSVKNNVLRLVPHLARFTDSAQEEGLDMFVVEVQDKRYIKSLSAFASLLRRVLFVLRESDEFSSAPLLEGVLDKHWNFQFRGTKLFVPTFAPLYRADHPRFSHEESSAFLVFQPDHCFTRRGITSTSSSRSTITTVVKDLYEKAGYSYDVVLVSKTPKAARYIHPLLPGEPWVRWWDSVYSGLD